tara:strand:+ start:585 stop:1043 length:459 start_codon:yes stop_codon:yes gene_type:complete
MKNKTLMQVFGGIFLFFIFGVFFGFWFIPMGHDHEMMDMGEMREHHISLKDEIIKNQIPMHKYRCCLENPCAYCIEKTPGHGKGATCDCLSDVVNGVHPCGECIGEIMEGHGNPFLAQYFAKAIAEKVGMQHIGSLKAIMFDMYGIAVADQV